MTFIRITLSDPKKEFDPFNIDLFVDRMGIINDKIVTYGRWGKLNSDDIWPLILLPGASRDVGRMDFGQDASAPTLDLVRFAETNIYSKRIATGEFVTVWYSGDEICYRITQAKELPSGDDFTPEPMDHGH